MKTSTRLLSIAAAVLALGAGGFAFAQAAQGAHQHPGGGMGMQHGKGMHDSKHSEMGGGMGRGMHGANQPGDTAARLAATKTELKITAAQEPAWQAFEAVVQQQAQARQAMRTSMQARMKDPAAAANVDHAAMRETMQKHRESEQAARDTARQALNAVLSPEQKALADQRLSGGMGGAMGGGHGQQKGAHRHAG